MSRRIVAAALVIGLAGPAVAVELNSKAIAIKQADEMKWRDPTGAAPVNQKVLFGDPSKPGYYMVMNRFKPGTFSKPHFHPNDRFITVVQGTWYVGTGNKWDKDATIGVNFTSAEGSRPEGSEKRTSSSRISISCRLVKPCSCKYEIRSCTRFSGAEAPAVTATLRDPASHSDFTSRKSSTRCAATPP